MAPSPPKPLSFVRRAATTSTTTLPLALLVRRIVLVVVGVRVTSAFVREANQATPRGLGYAPVLLLGRDAAVAAAFRPSTTTTRRGGGSSPRLICSPSSLKKEQDARSFPWRSWNPHSRRTRHVVVAEASSSTGGPGGPDTNDGGTAAVASPDGAVVANVPKLLTDHQKECIRSYLNKHHAELLEQFALIFTSIGADIAQANVWSGGSMELVRAVATSITETGLILEVTTRKRNQPDAVAETVMVPLDADPVPQKSRQFPALPTVVDDPARPALDDWCRRAARLGWIANQPDVSGKLVQLALQLHNEENDNHKEGIHRVGELPPNLYLNQVPHNRFVRQHFYDQASEAVLEAVLKCSQKQLTNRMQVLVEFPELNPSMDSYRIGTLLEMVRAIALRLAEENVRVKVCVQKSMGVGIFTGLPKQLGGVARLLELMDWQTGPGELNEGVIGTYVNFGAVGPEYVQNQVTLDGEVVQHADDVFVLVAPQSMVGTDSSIVPLLRGMVDAAGDRPVVLINPDLTDRVSSAGQQSVRGRQERIDFATSFQIVHCFQNIYVSGTSYFPILGAMTKTRHSDPWIAHQRRDLANGGGELYVPVLMSETRPDGQNILASFER